MRKSMTVGATFRFDPVGDGFGLVAWGECWGNWKDGKIQPVDLTRPDVQGTVAAVEKSFAEAWSAFGVKGSVGHDANHFWFNAKIPLGSLDALRDSAFGAKFRSALAAALGAFMAIKPFCAER